jgi:hypothetical protein
VSAWLAVRIGLVVFVFAWIVGPRELRDAVPIAVVFAIALGLEVSFLVGALREAGHRVPDRGPQEVDRDRFGFGREPEELVIVDDGDAETWYAVSEEEEEEEEDVEDEDVEPAAWTEPRAAPFRRFLVGLGVIAALVVAIWWIESRTGWDSISGERRAAAVERFSAEASRIAEKPVSIRCDESRDYVGAVQHADGVAFVGGDRAYLTPEICHDLYRLAFDGEERGSRTGRALAVLAHEAWHLRGVSNEGTTECYALQSGVELGRRLGLDEGTARRLMAQQLTENALRGASSLEYRVPPDCRDGGGLDLDRVGTRFP